MRVALLTSFAGSRREPLAEMLDRVRQGFIASGLPEALIRFNFGDGLPVTFSSVDRVLKRYPELSRFVTEGDQAPGIRGGRRISNGPVSPGANEAIPYATLRAIAAGVPRSFPFHSVAIHFHSPEFGELMATGALAPEMLSGVLISDSWRVNGRSRSLTAFRTVEVEPGDKKPPSPSGPVATVLAACGKAKKTIQAPLAGALGPAPVPAVRLPAGVAIPSAKPEVMFAVKAVSVKYRDSMLDVVARARLPHDLPGNLEMMRLAMGIHAGPKKPALERVFQPMGYSIRGGTGGETGSFSLRWRTPANSTLELHLDCGTWSHSLLAMFKVWGLGFKATLIIPPITKAVAGSQYPIGDADRWRKVAENLGALVAELERTFVPEIEAVAGPSPDWYEPES